MGVRVNGCAIQLPNLAGCLEIIPVWGTGLMLLHSSCSAGCLETSVGVRVTRAVPSVA